MRVAVLSDIHANHAALSATITDAERAGIDEYLVLGDIVDLGPDPAAVVERVRGLGCTVVRGNHDSLEERSPAAAVEAMRQWTATMLSDDQREWLKNLPDQSELTLGGCRLLAVHASPGSLTQPILSSSPDAELAARLAGRRCDVLCCGHTHLQLLRRIGAVTIVNVGSVGMPFKAPFDGNPPSLFPWAEYAILDLAGTHLSVDLRRVPYDFSVFKRAFRASGFTQSEELLAAWVE